MQRVVVKLIAQNDPLFVPRFFCRHLQRSIDRLPHRHDPWPRSSIRCLSTSNLGGGLNADKRLLSTPSFSIPTEHDPPSDTGHPSKQHPPTKSSKMTLQEAVSFITSQNETTIKEDLIKAIKNEANADKKLIEAIVTLESDRIGSLETGAILACLKSVNKALGQIEAGKTFLVQNLENTLMWKARNCSMRELTTLLSFSVKYRPESFSISTSQLPSVGVTNSRSLLYKEIVKSVERRWVEVSDGRTFVGILHYPDCFAEQFIVKLEDRMTELAETLPTTDLILILKDLAFKKRRPVPLLRALSYHLVRSKDDLSLKTISDCLFALKELSFKDLDLLDALCHSAVKKVDEDGEKTRTVLRSMLTCIGQLRFSPKYLLDKISSKFFELKDELEVRDLVAFMVTTATVNYVPKNSAGLYDLAIERLTLTSLSGESVKSEILWLDIVWSLTVLEKVQSQHLESVLSADFHNKLLYSHDHRNVGVILKLLNVNAAAENIYKDTYKGPTISIADDPLLRDVKLAVKTDRVRLLSNIFESFHALASPPNYLATDVNTLMGFHIDGEALFDNKMKPLDLTEYEGFAMKATLMASQNPPKNFKQIPVGSQRVAIMVVGYHECLIGSNEFNGLTALCVKLLQSKSYKVLLLKHDDLKPQHKKVERVKILEQKLKETLSMS